MSKKYAPKPRALPLQRKVSSGLATRKKQISMTEVCGRNDITKQIPHPTFLPERSDYGHSGNY